MRRARLKLWSLMAVAAALIAVSIGAAAWSSSSKTERIAAAMTGGSAQRAPELLRRYGCAGCHTIPGVPGADGQVGPSLEGLRKRVYLGGAAFNSPDRLVQWLVAPQSLSPHSAMPATGITEAGARDVAAYLYGR